MLVHRQRESKSWELEPETVSWRASSAHLWPKIACQTALAKERELESAGPRPRSSGEREFQTACTRFGEGQPESANRRGPARERELGIACPTVSAAERKPER